MMFMDVNEFIKIIDAKCAVMMDDATDIMM
jgi:hypothetical protein